MNRSSTAAVLVRHGETDANREHRFCGWTDVDLTDVGRVQARALGQMLDPTAFDGVWSSDLSRCVETARLAGLRPTVDPRLREINFGRLELSRFDDLNSEQQAALVAFDGFVAPGGESVSAFAERVQSFFEALPVGRHLVVTHGGVIRTLLRARGREVVVVPGSMTEIDLGPSEE